MTDRMIGVGLDDVVVGSASFDPHAGPTPRHRLPYAKEEIKMTSELTGRLRCRDPKAPLSQQEKAVFGSDARQHPVTGYPLEAGCTDHVLTKEAAAALYGAASGQPPSDDKQAAAHFMLMIGDLQKVVAEHNAESDPVKKAQHAADHEVTAMHVASVAEQLIDQGVLNKTALTIIPQL
jgi:hypothetical protein